ncbi:MAG: stalk domain-containing protein [Bacillota bacterium]
MFGLYALFLLTGLLFTFSMANQAQASEMKVLLHQMADPAQAAEVKVLLNGQELSMDVKPVIENGRTLAPLRAIFEALGAKVDWDDKTGTVTAVRDSTSIKLVIDSATALKNDEEVKLDVPAKIYNGRTLVPLRFVSEALGARVDWDEANREVLIAAGGVSAAEPAKAGRQKSILVTEHIVTPQGAIEKRSVRVPSPPRRVVVLGAYQAEMLKALGQEGRVVAVTDSIKNSRGWLKYVSDLPSVGSAVTPDIEKIISLRPDLVLDWTLKPELASQLNRAGIPVMRVYGYKADFLLDEIRILGRMFDCQQRADSYANFIEGHWKAIQDITKKAPNKKIEVYWESSTTDWSSAGPGHGAMPLLNWAKGESIAAGLGLANPRLSPEYVTAKNPTVIIKTVSIGYGGVSAKGIGFDGVSTDELKALQQSVMSRPALRGTRAVKQNKVFLISAELSNGPGSAAGAYYIAKWLQPELFKDINPALVHQEMLAKFYGEELRGIWVYPPVN